MAASRNKRNIDLPARVSQQLAARLAGSESLCVGLSGGCDSVVLLHLLSRQPRQGRLSAIHVHHGLSPNADAWADFCAGLCAQLGIPLQIRPVQVDRTAGLGLEAAARQARYQAFSAIKADCLLLAHHRGDQAETLLFNLLRGTGIVGAAGMQGERQVGSYRLLRPLLGASRAEIERYALAHGLSWVDDESNRDLSLSRNYLRHEVLTVVSRHFPAAESALAQAAENFAEAGVLLDELAAADWLTVAEQEDARLDALRLLSGARLKNLLRYRLRCLGWRVPVAARIDEFARQLCSAGPDRHPELRLPDGVMRAGRGRLCWLAEK